MSDGNERRALTAGEYTVPDSLASNAHTLEAALAAAHAVNECRVILHLLIQNFPRDVDGKLRQLELAYYRRADQLPAPPPPPKGTSHGEK